MKDEFNKYVPRRIQFEKIEEVGDWKVKVYTLTFKEKFEAFGMLDNAINCLDVWLEKAKDLNLPTYQTAFLIVHEGKDGVWSMPHWWIGGEMLQKMTFYTGYKNPNKFELLPNEGSMSCVWDLHIITHESIAWRIHILEKSDSPDAAGYLGNIIDGEI